MKWLLNKTNHRQWGKLVNDRFFCGQRQTLTHILNCCQVSLQQGRYTARHDNILHYIASCLDNKKYTFFVDIEGKQAQEGGMIPSTMVVATLKPDIVILDQRKKSAAIFELTVTGEMRLV